MRPPPTENIEKTEVVVGLENVIDRTLQHFAEVTNKFDNCTDSSYPSALISVEIMRKAYRELRDRGVKIRFITEITNENVQFVKEIFDLVSEVRHLDGVKGNLAILDGRWLGVTATVSTTKAVEQLVISTVKALIEQQQYFFEMLWQKAIPAELKIREIEKGIEPEIIETFRHYKDIQKIAFDLIRSAQREILILFATANAFSRQSKAGMLDLLKGIIDATNNYGPKIKILSPVNSLVRKRLHELGLQMEEKESGLKNLLQGKLEFRNIKSEMQTKVSMLIVDRRYSLTVELIDDSKDRSSESIGLATYSNSKATVLSYASIFESLWDQIDLYEQLWNSNKMLEISIEQLRVRDEAQNMFINIAAHELRTPIQPILALSTVLRSHKKNIKQDELLDAIVRNAVRLKRLTEDILDVTRIESKALILNKEMINLRDVILPIIHDYSEQLSNNNGDDKTTSETSLKIVFDVKSENQARNISLFIDEYRLTQVISNLLSNAIKFSRVGVIIVGIKRLRNKQVMVYVKDSGRGIDSDIFPRLFTKFASKSDKGTGLGLFICKNIIEAHGGKIWAKNNMDERGATFAFSLPLPNI